MLRQAGICGPVRGIVEKQASMTKANSNATK